jgi:hypothetical protein
LAEILMAAGIVIRDASADRTITEFHVIDAGSTDRTITQGRIIGADRVDRVFWDPSGTVSFNVTISPGLVSGTEFGTGTATTGTATASATGGTGPYTFAWTLISYTHPTTAPTITSAATAATKFIQTNIGAGADYSADFRVTATDSIGNTGFDDITAFWTDAT